MSEEVIDCKEYNKYVEMYEEIYNDYYRVVLRLAYKIVPNTYYVEDLVQDVFLKVFMNLSSYNPKLGSMGAWLIKVSTNHIYDYLRHDGKEPVAKIDDVSLLVDSTTTDEHNKDNDRIEYCTSELDELSRRVLICKAVYGYSHKEIANVLGITEDISKKRYRKACKAASVKWREYEEN